MALILNLETATTVCSVALGKDGVVSGWKETDTGYTHAEQLTLFIEDILKKQNLTINNLDAVAVSKGPGSYTGLRIGVSTAKGICYGTDKPLIGVSTLREMACRAMDEYSDFEGLLCPMIDARRMEVFTAMFDNNGRKIKDTAAEIIDENSFKDLLQEKKVLFFGNGAGKCREVLEYNKNAIFAEGIVPSARYMVPLSEKAYLEGRFEDVAYFEPYYLKDFVATKPKKII